MQQDKLSAVVVRSGSRTGLRIPLLGSPITCGRNSENDIPLKDDPLASAVHARLTCHDGQWFIEDVDSTNGTFLEAGGGRTQVTTPEPLAPGQQFLVGRTLLMLCAPQTLNHQSQSQQCNERCNEFDSLSQPPMHLRLEWALGRLKISLMSEKALARDWAIPVSEEELEELCARVDGVLALARTVGPGDVREDLAQAGELLARHLFPEPVSTSLFERTNNRLTISHVPSLIGVPWELAARDGHHLCLARSVARQILIDDSHCHFRSSAGCAKKDVLIIADPVDTLPEMRLHAETIAEVLREAWPSLRVTLLAGEQASRLEILQRLPEARIVYYAGHAEHDPADPTLSGWILKKGRLTAQDFRRLADSPSFVFANGCQTSRESARPQAQGWRHGMAGGFILAGVHGYLGAAWPLPVQPAIAFAAAWFQELAAGQTIGDCTQRARVAMTTSPHACATWPAYTCYGNPAAKLIF